MSQYKSLDSTLISQTINRLVDRIEKRFPDSGLLCVGRELRFVSSKATETSEKIGRPIIWVRIVAGSTIFLILAATIATILLLKTPDQPIDVVQAIQIAEAGTNDVIIIGAIIFFMMRLESRIKRHKAIQAIHELRSIAHIVDMHQLTKDPESFLFPDKDSKIALRRKMSTFELGRYLDYCSEMLSIISKLSALYVQNFDDNVVLEGASEIENLTNSLSNKIWQKIMILEQGTLILGQSAKTIDGDLT